MIKQLAWKLLFTLAILNTWFIYKIDIILAFTQGSIDSFLYLVQPEGFIDSKYPDYVLRLNKALYGLKQSARIQYFTLYKALVDKLGFSVLNLDSCLFINRTTNIIICIYVDDLAIIGPNKDNIKILIQNLKKFFNIKERGLIKDYLRIEVIRNSNTLSLKQTKYIEKVVEKYGFTGSKPIYTPMDSKLKLELNPNITSTEDIKQYQAIISCLLLYIQYLVLDLILLILLLS